MHPVFRFIAAVVLVVWTLPALAQDAPRPLTPDQWREDLAHLAGELERIHPGVFARTPKKEFDRAVNRLDALIPSMRAGQIRVGLMQLVALIPDAHSSVSAHDRRLDARAYFPLRTIELSDGVFVLSASPRHRDLVGAQVLAIGEVPVDSALALVATVIPHDSEFSVMRKRDLMLMTPAVLTGLDLIGSANELPLTVRTRDGREKIVSIAAVEGGKDSEWYKRGFGVPVDDFVTAYDANADDLPISLAYLGEVRGPRDRYWYTYLRESRTFYLRFNRVRDKKTEALEAFWLRMWNEVDNLKVERMIIDLRHNTGGNNFLVKPLIHGVIRRDRINRTGKLLVLIGRGTFSAAVSTAAWLETETDAVFIGEPTAQRPNLYSEPIVVTAPNSRFRIELSRYQWVHTWPWDERAFVPPDIAVQASSADLLTGRDPVLETALTLEGYETLTSAMKNALATGDSAAVGQAYRSHRSRTGNPWKSTFFDMLDLTYDLVQGERPLDAIRLGLLNTASYPDYPDGWVWLGEAYLGAERNADAIRCFRRALEITPDNGHAKRRLASLADEG